jgi:uncharacterized membrane protein
MAPIPLPVLMCAIGLMLLVGGIGRAAEIADADILAISVKHCVACHAAKPTHDSFSEPPKNIILESIGDMRRHAPLIIAQTIENKAMPPGNQTGMTEAERDMLARWLRALP